MPSNPNPLRRHRLSQNRLQNLHRRAQRNDFRRRDDHRGAELISDAQPRREVVRDRLAAVFAG
jgi:hypothetical protein